MEIQKSDWLQKMSLQRLTEGLQCLFPEIDLLRELQGRQIIVTGPALVGLLANPTKPKSWHSRTKSEVLHFLNCTEIQGYKIPKSLLQAIGLELQLSDRFYALRCNRQQPALTFHSPSVEQLGQLTQVIFPKIYGQINVIMRPDSSFTQTHPDSGLILRFTVNSLAHLLPDNICGYLFFDARDGNSPFLSTPNFSASEMTYNVDITRLEERYNLFQKQYNDVVLSQLTTVQTEALIPELNKFLIRDLRVRYQEILICEKMRITVVNFEKIVKRFEKYERFILYLIRNME